MSATSDKKCGSFTQSFLPVAVSWVILLVILALHIYFTSVISENNEKLTAENQQLENLTYLNNTLSSENERLRRDKDNQTVIIGNLTKKYNVSEMKINKLTAENQQLKTEKNKLTEQIQNIENTVVQQIFDAYNTTKDGIKQRELCLKGWLYHQSSCYAVHTYTGQKTWEEAREDCRRWNSDLAVIVNEDEKKFISDNSWRSSGDKGYWIGLRAEAEKWKWIDGSVLAKKSWMTEHAYNGYCAISVQNQGWKSAWCDYKNGWICKKAALSV